MLDVFIPTSTTAANIVSLSVRITLIAIIVGLGFSSLTMFIKIIISKRHDLYTEEGHDLDTTLL